MGRIILDTHALLWWLVGDSQLSPRARAAITDEGNTVLVSAATAWEVTTKHRLGKLAQAAELARDVLGSISAHGFEGLPVNVLDAERAGRLPGPHADPFDRMLIAQALGGDYELVSNEAAFDAYGVRRLW